MTQHHLALLELGPDGQGPLRVTPVALGEDGQLALGEPVEIGVTVRRDIDGRAWLAAVGGSWLYVARLRGPGRRQRFVIERWSLSGEPTGPHGRIELDVEPTALCATGERCLVASDCTVSLLDFSNGQGFLADRFDAPGDDSYKRHFDALAVHGDIVFAVDDVVVPKFVFVIRVVEGSWLEHLSTAPLPDYPNETYWCAAASEDHVAALSVFYHMGGGGQRLVVFARDIDDLCRPRVVTEFLEREEPGFADEDRELGPELLAGDTPTRWHSAAIVGPRILIAAGARGLLHRTLTAGGRRQTAQLDLGGEVVDVVNAGDRACALVAAGDGAARIAVLRVGASGKVKVEGSVDVPGAPVRLLG